MTARARIWIFLAGIAGLAACYVWALTGLPGFGNYPGPYGYILNHVAVLQTNATGVVSAINFEYRGFDTVGEEFILFITAVGVSTVLRHLRGEHEEPAGREALGATGPESSETVRQATILFVGPVLVTGWYLGLHAQATPSGGFQGGVVLATAFILIYLAGQFLVFRRVSPAAILEATGAVGAGGFAAVGAAGMLQGLPYLYNFLPLGTVPGSVTSSGTIALISFFVGLEVAAAFVLMVSELLAQTLVIGGAR